MRSNLILIMSLSGSLVGFFYLLLVLVLREHVTVQFRCGLLRAALVFFVVPFPDYKYRIPWPLHQSMVSRPAISKEGWPVIQNAIQLGSDWDHTLVPLWVKTSLVFLGFAAVAAGVTLCFQIFCYFRARRDCKKRGTEELSPDLMRLQAELHIRQRVKLVFLKDCAAPFAIGFLRPIVAVPTQAKLYEREEWEFVLRHELAHIKNKDLWWKLLGLVAVALHCFNPVSYFLFFELCRMCEIRCDSMATEGYSKEKKGKIYLPAAGPGRGGVQSQERSFKHAHCGAD